MTYDDSSDGAIIVDLVDAGPTEKSELFQAIPERQSTRAVYDGEPVSSDRLNALEDAAGSSSVAVQLFTDKSDLETILEYVVAGNTAQMNDQAFVDELKASIRFNESAAVEHRDGLFSASSGNPTVPGGIGKTILRFAFTEGSENGKYRDHVRSSAGAIAFVSDRTPRKAGSTSVAAASASH